MRRWIAAMAVTASLIAAGCSPTGRADEVAPPTASSASSTGSSTTVPDVPAPVGGLLATIGTNRLYAPNRELGLGLENVGDAPVLVREIQLVSDLFAPVAPSARDLELPAGSRRLVLPLPYGAVRCDGGSPELSVLVVTGDGRRLQLPTVEDHPGSLRRLHGRECAAADVRERVDIAFGDDWSRDGVAITGELRLSKLGNGPPVAIDDAVGNVIFTLVVPRTADRPVLRVTDEATTAAVRVTISADRCDPHAVAEFKRPFVFLSWVAVGPAAPVPVELEVTGPARSAMEDLLRRC